MTKVGWAALGLSVPLYLASLTSQSSLLLTLVGILFGAVLVNYLSARRVLIGLELEIPAKTRVEEGTKVLEPWSLKNQNRQVLSEVCVRLGKDCWWFAGAIPAVGTIHVPPTPPKPKRGIYPLRHFLLTTNHPFGLVCAEKPIDSPAELVVYPTIPIFDPPAVAGQELMIGGKQRGSGRMSAGGLFSGVRPHQPGDPLKQVHWKSTAKGLGLMVKTYEEELSGRLNLLLDQRADSFSASEFESAVKLAGGLLFASMDAGNQVHFHNLATGERSAFTPFSDPESLFDFLAELETNSQPESTGEFIRSLSLPPTHNQGTRVLILGSRSVSSEEERQAVSNLKGRCLVYLPDSISTAEWNLTAEVHHYAADGTPS